MVSCKIYYEYNFQNVRFQCFVVVIAIKRQWSLECILKLEGFAKAIGFLLHRDLHLYMETSMGLSTTLSYVYTQV